MSDFVCDIRRCDKCGCIALKDGIEHGELHYECGGHFDTLECYHWGHSLTEDYHYEQYRELRNCLAVAMRALRLIPKMTKDEDIQDTALVPLSRIRAHLYHWEHWNFEELLHRIYNAPPAEAGEE